MTDRTNYCAGCHAREHLLESVALDAEGTRTQRDRAVELLEVAQELLHESGIRVDDLDAFLAKQERKPCACTNKEVDGAFVGESCDRCAPPMKLEREPCQRCGGEGTVPDRKIGYGSGLPKRIPCPDCQGGA